jgi:hypothetical protein
MKNIIKFILITLSYTVFCDSIRAGDLQPGNRYKIIRPLYLMAVYRNDNRQLSKETAIAYLHAARYANRYFVAFQCKVSEGTIMTIISLAPKVWYLPFSAKRYFVRLDPDVSRGLNIEFSLDRGLEGILDGLNPELFVRLKD